LGLATRHVHGTILLTLIALFLFFTIEILQYRNDFLVQINHLPHPLRLSLYSLLVVITLTFGTAYTGIQQAFIYFQF
jgi:hypothetical protein